MDMNKNTECSMLVKSFRRIELVDLIKHITLNIPPTLCNRGLKQIDIVWVSGDLKVNAASFYLFNFRVGNHKVIVVDLDINQILGSKYIQFSKTSPGRLITSN